jgi:hypothetical protein
VASHRPKRSDQPFTNYFHITAFGWTDHGSTSLGTRLTNTKIPVITAAIEIPESVDGWPGPGDMTSELM